MEYVARVPAPPLDLFIDDIYCLTGVPRHRRMNVPPMPSAHLLVNLGGPVCLCDPDPSVPSAVFTDGWFMGVWTRRFLLEYPTWTRLVGVHFKPWGMSAFAGIPAAELRDRWVPADAVWQRSLDRIRNRVGKAASATGALQALEEELRSRLAAAPSRGLGLVQYTGGRLAASYGTVPVGVLSDAAGVSGNHLAAQFKSHVGVTPKRVARIYRFARLIVSVDALRPVDWPWLAQTAGYFDQAHSRTTWLATVNEDGSPHVTAVGALWLDGTFWFQTGAGTRKGRNVARDPRCSVAVSVRDADVVIEGDAARVTEPGALARIAKAWADQGWPAEPDDSGPGITAPFNAPSQGPPPWNVYRIEPRSAIVTLATAPGGLTRFRF